MIIVSDSSPLIAFSLIGRLELIKELYEIIIIPEAVHREITEIDEQRTGVQEIIAAEWLIVERITNERFVRALEGELDRGEGEAIVLATELNAGLLLMDERRGRQVAKRCNLNVIGVLGILIEAKHKGLVPLAKPLLDELV